MHRGVLIGIVVACGVLILLMLGIVYTRAQTNPRGALDVPADGATVSGSLAISGWAIDAGARNGTGVDGVALYLDGQPVGEASYGLARSDIAAAFGQHFVTSGWSTTLDAGQLTPGAHMLEARAHSTLSDRATSYSTSIVVASPTEPVAEASPASPPLGALDVPADGEVVTGSVDVRGWALDPTATDGPGVDRVELFVDGRSLGLANYGVSRPDVGDTFGAQFDAAGWAASIDLRGQVGFGQHTLEVRARSKKSGLEADFTRRLIFAAATAPHGTVDEPQDGATVRGTVETRGWALDEAAADGAGVDRVRLYVDGSLLGEAEYGVARPEIGSAYGERFTPSGWRAQLDVTTLAVGSHTLEARARSSATGEETSYSRTFVVAR